jgi:hypothetical protein
MIKMRCISLKSLLLYNFYVDIRSFKCLNVAYWKEPTAGVSQVQVG